MKQLIYILFFFGILNIPQVNYAQVDFNKTPDDDLGIVEDQFQELFFEALKQKGVENYDRAVDALQKCIEIDKSPAILYFELGKNYIKLKNFGAAEDALKTAVEKAPDNEWYLDELYGYYVSQNDLKKALKTVQQLVQYHPDYKQDLANLYVKMEKYDAALEILDELDASFGISVSRDVLRNRIYKATGRAEEQIENLQSRVDKNPKNEANYLALIYRYSEQGEKQKAFETAQGLLKIQPNSQVVHLALYKFYLDKNNTEEAINSMKIVVQSNEIKPDAKLKVLSDFVNFVKDNPQYEADLLEATALLDGATDAKTLTDLGLYYLNKGDKENALKNFQEALKLDDNNFSILRNVLMLHIDLKQFEVAKTKSDAAIIKYPAQPLPYLVNGIALNALQKPKEAITTLESGLDWIVDDNKIEADFYRELAKAYNLLNNTAKAKSFMDKANALKS
ncbi:tetratricopeptide repeat protein [Hyunsoonleella pacifica]|uniref:Tetratricopeptide repeat protein n=1 Tax=Hyunsoonleella pacifica TaxID=1080224 RepID=A0A4Q9FR71_9FLAO|nr:tetratricopeptide repeat protein [Hyunsoonleella pacifica]TBN16771.1 tetratricopeptide repeat protein [Hyunsoonleella pacifica]GGD16562.1 cytochrome c biosynthesis protein [Hyunsoonleella pacifica]